jgi:hypothetical protein
LKNRYTCDIFFDREKKVIAGVMRPITQVRERERKGSGRWED